MKRELLDFNEIRRDIRKYFKIYIKHWKTIQNRSVSKHICLTIVVFCFCDKTPGPKVT